MDLSSQYTFSNPAQIAKAQGGAYSNVRLFMYGDMGTKYEEDAPAWATTSGAINSASDSGGKWGNMSLAVSAASGTPTLFQSFSATCLYFGLQLTEQMGPSAPPIGLIQTGASAVFTPTRLACIVCSSCVHDMDDMYHTRAAVNLSQRHTVGSRLGIMSPHSPYPGPQPLVGLKSRHGCLRMPLLAVSTNL
jgi:hypothetical protein